MSPKMGISAPRRAQNPQNYPVFDGYFYINLYFYKNIEPTSQGNYTAHPHR